VASSLTLGPDEVESEAGRALVEDAVRRVKHIDVSEQFRMRVGWQYCLPLAAIVGLIVLVVLPNATVETAGASTSSSEIQNQLKKQRDALRKKIEERKKKEATKDLDDADLKMFEKLAKGLDEISKNEKIDKKEALIKLNDLAKDLAQKREKSGGADDLRRHMQNLKNIEKGPADKVTEAIKDGDFNKAIEEIKKLQEKMENGELNDADREKLAQQLNQMKEKLQAMVDAQAQAKRDVERQLKEAREKNDVDAIDKLQKKLDQLQAQDQQMQKMQEMADKMGACAECMKNGDMQQAGENLKQLADNLKNLQNELDQLEMIDEALDELAQAKNACAQCEGMGMQMGMGQDGQGQNGMGLGDGQGQGLRPEEENETKNYESRVRGNIQKGEAVFAGDATGPNKAGQTVEQVKEAISASLSEQADPIADQRLPPKQQRHAKEYFDQFNK
jgi:hypothetical protein